MKTVTFFRDMDFPIVNGRIAYLADHTYPDVPEPVVEMMLERGVGEVVPDDVLGRDPDIQIDPPLTKVSRTRMRKKWGPQ